MPRPLATLAAALLCAACREPPAPPGPFPWPDARAARVASDGEEQLELRHRPGAAPGALPTVELALLPPRGGQILFADRVSLERRDALFGARWALAREPAPGERRAVSLDGGATFLAALPVGAERFLCSHLRAPSIAGKPDWAALPTVQAWAAGVLETAVWGCDRSLERCRSRALAQLAAHAGEPEADLLATSRAQELRAALAAARALPASRALAVALVDAAIIVQPGLDDEELAALGALAGAKFRAAPLGRDERKALALRVSLARMEVRQDRPGEGSARTSTEALAQALEEQVPEAIPARP